MLSIREVAVEYGANTAVHPISFDVDEGTILGLIGADGSGKSSLLHAIAGLIPFRGEIAYGDDRFHAPKEAERLKKTTGLMPQGLGLMLYNSLSVEEHFDFFTDVWGLRRNEAYFAYKVRLLHMSGLSKFGNRLAGNLSGGMRQKLSLVCTLLHKPKLLLLDEPTTGVDPLSRVELWEILEDIVREERITCIVSTAYMDEAAKMDGVILLEEGRMIARGKADALIESMRDFTYVENTESVPGALNISNATYALDPLPLPKQEPTLEALFFVNFLRQRKTFPTIDIAPKELNHNGSAAVMEARKLTKRFNGFTANESVSMLLNKGEIVGLLGPNGAGKTTFLKMLLGLLPTDEGELYLLGKHIHNTRDRQFLKGQIGYVSQHFSLYKKLTLRENLLYFAQMHHIEPSKAFPLINEYAAALGFTHYLDALPGKVPMGINQRLSVAAALLHEPVILFLDEPTSGVDTVTRAVFWEIMHKLKRYWKISILITTHYMSEAAYCDRVVLLKDGKKVADDRVDALYAAHEEAKTFEDIFMAYCRAENGGGAA